MKEDPFPNSSSILLGRPFLKTSRAKIDVFNGSLTMEFDGDVIKFNIYDAMRFPADVSSICTMDVLDPIIQRTFDQSSKGALQTALDYNLTAKTLGELCVIDTEIDETVMELESFQLRSELVSFIQLSISKTKILPSIMQAP